VSAEPPIPGLADVPHWGSREATSAKEAPRRLVILGGGVVGCEMAQAFRRLGSEVVLVSDIVLKRAEPFAGDMVAAGLRAEGVDVRTSAVTSKVEQDGDDVMLTVDGEPVRGDALLVATGRRPTTTDLGVERVGLEPGRPLEVDDSGRVGAVDGGWLYAAGDVTGRAPLTHQGKYAGRAVGDAIAARARGTLGAAAEPWSTYASTADHTAVPQVVFTDPEVAWVGPTEREAREAGLPVRPVDVSFGSVSGASLHADGYDGRARMLVDTQRGVLLGATFVGPDVAELVHGATIAVVGEVPLARLWHAVPSFPTMSEVWLRLLEAYGM
jgi:dihydrolipoamide dehydrogenase